MIKPPSTGTHGRHRILGTPGPTGWNDHGDPSHWRREGPTPGPLSVNDHGTPLPGQIDMLPPERSDEVSIKINEIIANADASESATLVDKLQACLNAVRGETTDDHAQDETSRCIESYFHARLLAFQGKTTLSHDADRPGPFSGSALHMGAVEYRTMGTYFHPAATARTAIATFGLSYQRIGQSPPDGHTRSSTSDSASDWIEQGILDGLRDRAVTDGKLCPHAAGT